MQDKICLGDSQDISEAIDKIEHWQRWGVTGTLIHCWRGAKSYSDFERQFLKKLNILLPYDPAVVLPGIYPNELETCPHKNLHMDVGGSFIHNCQKMKATKMSFPRWIDKLWCIQTMEYYSIILKKRLSWQENTWRRLKCISLSERSRSEKATCCIIPTIWYSVKGEATEAVQD